MANYSTTANVVLSVNGRQAQRMLSQLEKDAARLEKQISAAAASGDKVSMKKFRRELNSTQRMMDQLKGSSASVEKVLANLDKASPKELNKTLRKLKNELNGIERGTAAWDAQIAKIKAVKSEIDKVNSSMREQQSLSDRIIGWINKWQMALVGVGATITGLVMAGRKAVNAYAEMEQEMANVRKYTGLDAEAVEQLNEEFKKIDTRSSREELNQLAQQAGRLGKTAPDDILGFVRAADKINVALDDLGEDATLTLSKLTGIFGDEKRLGTEKALLSVGSVINELSQNCAASAPYLAEFASRMGGVGAQAGMSVQQIMGFGAVLDANNQAVEASSTALSQVIVRIFQEPEKYARVAGMNVQHFADLVRTDMNAALIEFLSALNKAGGMDSLSPMFKDMGENGARAISALSTLATNIDMVRSQQSAANKAFSEATSIDKEFAVQNNTVMASMDKAKKNIKEIAVELGQKLQPVMRLVISSTTVAVKALSVIVDTFFKYRKVIIVAVSAITSYYIASKLAVAMQAMHNAAVKTGTFLQTAYTAAVHLGKSAMLLLTGNIKGATAAFRAFSTAIKANPVGLLVAGVTSLVGVLGNLVSRYNDNIRKMREQREEMEKLKHECTDYASKAADAYSAEILKLQTLYKAATDEARSREERIRAAKQLQALYPDIFAKYSAEEIMLRKAESAYNDLSKAIIRKAEAQAAAELYKENYKKLLEYDIKIGEQKDKEKQGWADKAEIDKRNDKRRSSTKTNKQAETMTGALAMQGTGAAGGFSADGRNNMESTEEAKKKIREAKSERFRLTRERNVYVRANNYLWGSFKGNSEFQDQILGNGNSSSQTTAIPSTSGSGGSTGFGSGFGGGGTDSSATDPLQAEKDWKEKELAQNRIDFYRGEKSYIDYKDRINEIDVQYYAKMLENASVSGNERLKAEADMLEARKRMQEEHNTEVLKQNDEMSQKVVAIEQASYDDARRRITDNYLQGKIDKKTYDEALAMLEEQHLKRMVEVTYSGTKERADAEKALEQYRLQQMERRRKEIEDIEKKHQERLSEIKKRFFGLNYSERRAEFEAAKALLEEQYAKELATVADNEKEKERIRKAYAKALKELEDELNGITPKGSDGAEPSWLGETGDKILKSFSLMASGITSIMEGVTSMIEAELQLQTAAIEQSYDREARAAEGNSYRLRKAEKKKQKELAALRADAARKRFGMQVFQTVATTAQNAVQAYGNALQIGGLLGNILAPIAAAAAVAAGAVQIAVIKKQMQQSEAQGYRQGGFTRPGRPDEPAGVVHAGEWVASQRLVNDPRTRPLLEALDYAQRTNTIGSITAADVSRSVTAPLVLAARQPAAPVVVQPAQPAVVVQQNAEYADTMRRLSERLEQPFVTVNTVAGELGIKQAQDKYNRLMANKSPRRK